MIVPSQLPPSSPSGPLSSQDTAPVGGDGVPSQTNMLMALAEMHKMGRLSRDPKAESRTKPKAPR